MKAFYLEHGEEDQFFEASEDILENEEVDQSEQLHAFFAQKAPKKVTPPNKYGRKPPGHIQGLLTPPPDGGST